MAAFRAAWLAGVAAASAGGEGMKQKKRIKALERRVAQLEAEINSLDGKAMADAVTRYILDRAKNQTTLPPLATRVVGPPYTNPRNT